MSEILVARTPSATIKTVNDLQVIHHDNPKPLMARVMDASRKLQVPAMRDAQDDTPRHATIACIIPAYNEQDTIADVLNSLLVPDPAPDIIHVVVNNTDDETLERVKPFVGPHTRVVKGEQFETVVHVHDMGKNPDKKVGALNYGWRLSRATTTSSASTATPRCDRQLRRVPRGRDGGRPSHRWSVGDLQHRQEQVLRRHGPFPRRRPARPVRRLQHGQPAARPQHGRARRPVQPVLGAALKKVMELHHQRAPWVRDSEVEDSKLSLQIKDAGFSTKISSRARAFVGPMTNLRALHGQQVKWNFGAIDLFWPGQRGDSKGQPLHPNLRLRWFENISMLFNIGTRMAFVLLLAASLSIHAFVFNPIWLLPPVVAAGLNLRLACSMHDKSASDLLYAALFFPAEFYLWVGMGHFLTAWTQFFARTEKDNWAAQAAAEKGRGSSYVFPAIVVVTTLVVLTIAWQHLSVGVQSATLSVGWPVLYLITVLQTLFMLRKLIRRHRRFTV